MSAMRTTAASAVGLVGVVRSTASAICRWTPQRRVRTPPTRAWSMPSSRRSAVDAVVGRAAAAVEALGVAGVQAGEHGPADVVEDRGEGELVAVAVAGDLGDPVGRPLDRKGVQAEAVGRERHLAVAVEEVVAGGRAEDRLDGAGAEALDGIGDAADAPAARELAGGADRPRRSGPRRSRPPRQPRAGARRARRARGPGRVTRSEPAGARPRRRLPRARVRAPRRGAAAATHRVEAAVAMCLPSAARAQIA